jgi:hypothetical protein
MFLLYHSDECNTSETVFHWCYVNDLHTTHAVVCWVITLYFWSANITEGEDRRAQQVDEGLLC